jgi:hypothetical protein
MVARYRYARALEQRGDEAAAREALETVITARPVAPPIVLASAFVDDARLAERAGDRARALVLYRYALDVVGGDPRAHDAAQRAIARLAPRDRVHEFLTFDRDLCLTANVSRP